MVRTCTKKRNKPDVLEEVIQEAVRAVQESRLSQVMQLLDVE